MTQEELVKDLNKRYELDLTRSTWASYEREAATPKLYTLTCFANYFGVTLDQLVSEKNHWVDGTSSAENMVTMNHVNSIAQTATDATVYWLFYKELHLRYVNILQSEKAYEPLYEKFKMLELELIIERNAYLQRIAKEKLDHREYLVFWGVYDKQELEEIAETLKMSKEEAVNVFNSAKTKIIELIENNIKQVDHG